MKKKTLLITMVLTIVMSTSVFAAGGDNYGEDIFGTTSSRVTTTKASATEKTTDKENIKNNVETCAAQNSTENKNILKKAKIVSIKRVNGNKAKIKLKKIDRERKMISTELSVLRTVLAASIPLIPGIYMSKKIILYLLFSNCVTKLSASEKSDIVTFIFLSEKYSLR